VGERIGATEGGRQAAPKAEKQPLGGRPPPGIFSHWGHVTRSHNIIGWLFRPLCVTMAYGLRMSFLGASEECCIAHNVHLLCPDLANKPNVGFKGGAINTHLNVKIYMPCRCRCHTQTPTASVG